MKKLISITLSLLMVLSVIPAFAFSASALKSESISELSDTCSKGGNHEFTNYIPVDYDFKCDTEICSKGFVAKVADCDKGCGSVSFICDNAEELKVTKDELPATCTEEGYTAEKSCPECGQVIIPSQLVPAKGHTYGEISVIKEPDYFNKGIGAHTCAICGYEEEIDLPIKTFGDDIVAIIGDYENPQKFTSLFGKGGAYEAAKDDGVIIIVKDFEETSDNVIQINKNITIDLVGHTFTASMTNSIYATADVTFRSTKSGLDASEKSEIKGKIKYSNNLINSSATTTFDNIEAVASKNTTIFKSQTPASNPSIAKLIIKNSKFTVSNTGANMAPIAFTANAVEVDAQDTTFQSGSGGNGIDFNSDVIGKFENCNFYKAKNISVTLNKTGTAGVEFKKCYFKQSAWDSTTFAINGGKAILSGGTVVDGANIVTLVAKISGGTLVLDGATIKGDKGDGSSKKLLDIGSNANIVYKNAAFIRGTSNGGNGSIYNNSDAFWNTVKGDECAVYSREGVTSGEFAFEFGTDISKQKAVYISKCIHNENTTTCISDGYCKHCGTEFSSYGHDYSGYNYDETGHWHACSRCGKVKDSNNIVKENHAGGKATCDSKAICEACGTGYGEAIGHDFTNSVIGFDETSHWIECEREDCDAKKEGSIEEHGGGKTICGEKPKCSKCQSEYGEVEGHKFINYVYNDDAGCTTNGTETAVCDNGCGTTDTKTIAQSQLGHDWVIDKEIPATCVSEGKTSGSHCSRCNIVREEPEVIPKSANAHKWDNGKITVAGDCCTDRILTYTCTLCKKTLTHNFGKVANKHVYSNNYTVDKKATYFETGLKAKYCVKCKKVKTSVTVIPKLKLNTPKLKYIGKTGNIYTVKYTSVTGATGFEIKYKVGSKWKTTPVTTKKSVSDIKIKKGIHQIQVRAFVKSGSKKAYSSYTKLNIK